MFVSCWDVTQESQVSIFAWLIGQIAKIPSRLRTATRGGGLLQIEG